MRNLLLASMLFILPAIPMASQTCAVSPAPTQTPTSTAAMPANPAPTSLPMAENNTSQNLSSPLQPVSSQVIAGVPVLARVASSGAKLLDLGTQHGLRTIFASKGNAFQVFYLAPDGEAIVGGVMWDASGHDVTRAQVASIPGTIPP